MTILPQYDVPPLPPRIGVARADPEVVRRVRAEEDAAEREREREQARQRGKGAVRSTSWSGYGPAPLSSGPQDMKPGGAKGRGNGRAADTVQNGSIVYDTANFTTF
jgi:hypothetical protein